MSEPAKLKKQTEGEGFSLPQQETIEKLNQVATKKLSEIVRRNVAQEPMWQGYNADEISAAKALLDSSSSNVVR